MSLTLTCTKCGQKLAIADELKGKQVKCPTCSEIYIVERKKPANKPATPSDVRAAIPVPSPPAPSVKSKRTEPNAKTSTAPSNTGSQQPPQNSQQPVHKTKAAASTADPNIAICGSCDAKMRRPTAPGVTAFLCPTCGATVTIAEPKVDVRAIKQTAPLDDDPFADLASLPPVASAHRSVPSAGSAKRFSSPTHSATNVRTAAARSHGSTSGNSKLLGPGLLIAIPYAIALLGTVFLLFTHVMRDERPIETGSYNGVLVFLGAMLINYVLVLLGSLRLIFGGGKIIAALTCIAALSPTIIASAIGIFVYPFAIGGGIWGIISLALDNSSGERRTSVAGTSSTSSATDYLRNAREESDRQPVDDVPTSGLKAAGFVVAGIALLCLACYYGYLFYQHSNGMIELRRPGRAISGAVICVITGFGLLTRGFSFFR